MRFGSPTGQTRREHTVYILDTDHLGILQRATGAAFKALSVRLAQHSQMDFFVAIVSFHEEILGWNAYIARAKDQAEIIRGYDRLARILVDFSHAQVLPFDDKPAKMFEDFRRQRIRIGTMDLRIACLALSNNMTVLTRNLVDFQRVPNLKIEDWTT